MAEVRERDEVERGGKRREGGGGDCFGCLPGCSMGEGEGRSDERVTRGG